MMGSKQAGTEPAIANRPPVGASHARGGVFKASRHEGAGERGMGEERKMMRWMRWMRW